MTTFSTDLAETVSDQATDNDLFTATETVRGKCADKKGKDLSYFDYETATLHLKGNIRNNPGYEGGTPGIILPEGVSLYDVEHIVAEEGTVFPEDSNYLFYEMYNLETVDLKKADTSKVTLMNSMFENCTTIKKVLIPHQKFEFLLFLISFDYNLYL